MGEVMPTASSSAVRTNPSDFGYASGKPVDRLAGTNDEENPSMSFFLGVQVTSGRRKIYIGKSRHLPDLK